MLARRTALAALMLAALMTAAVRADDVRKDTSLPLIPADAAFYSSSLRLKEQVDLFYKSKAYRALREIPSVKKLYQEAMEKLKEKGGPLEAYEGFLKGKGNKELMEVLGELVTDEVFLLGGKSWVPFMQLLSIYSNSTSFGMVEEILAGTSPERAQLRAALVAFQKNKEMIKVPDLVLGFRMKSKDKALAQLGRLEKYLNGIAVFVPQLEDRVKSKEAKDGKLLMLELDGGMIPWDGADLSDFERNKGEFDALLAHLKKLKLTVTLAVRGQYVLLSLAEKADEAERLGGEGKKLIDRPELKPVLAVADRKFVSLGYVSKELAEASAGANTDYKEVAKKVKEALKGSTLPDARKKALMDDIDELAEDLKGLTVKPGANVGYVLLTDYGFEQMGYDHGDHSKMAKVKLGLTQHLGGSPLFAAAVGFEVDGSSLATMIKLGKKAFTHAEGFFLDFVDNDMADQYRKVMKALTPKLQKLEEVLTRTLVPSMKQGGLGLVLDGKWKSKEWVKGLELGGEMPLPELGLLIGISDGAKFTDGMKGLRLAFNDLYAAIRDLSPAKDDMPEVSIPAPKSDKTDGGPLYWWEMAEVGLDRQVQPTAGVGKSAAVLALSRGHATRLIKPTPLKFRDPQLAFKGDVVALTLLDWVGMVDTYSPWVDKVVGMVLITPSDDEDAKKKAKVEAARIAKEVRTMLEVFKAFKGLTSVTRLEGGVLVTRTVYVIRDIEGVVEP
jgi:hypothetical protein